MPEMKALTGDEPTVREWVNKLRTRNPALSMLGDYTPAAWIGVVDGERILFACGYTAYNNGTFFIHYWACEPSRLGKSAMLAAIPTLRMISQNHKAHFVSQINNRKMLKIYRAIGAKPVAAMFEIGV